VIVLYGPGDVRQWLREEDPGQVAALFREADETRRREVGDEVHLRGLVEISNHCARDCAYCGIRASRDDLARYRIPPEEVVELACRAADLGYGTVVLQGGEDPGWTTEAVTGVVREIRARTPLAVTLSLGERDPAELRTWREAGADRYLLRFETSDPDLHRRIHPPLSEDAPDRFALLRVLRDLDYEVGSGVMVGIPGQTWETLARDLWRFRELDLDMIGLGPWLPHPDTPLGAGEFPDAGAEQVPNDVPTVLRCLALARLLRPDANIPSTTALATLGRAEARAEGLRCGANVVMPNLTPRKYRMLYEIYPDKGSIEGADPEALERLRRQIADLGRTVGRGAGPRRGKGR